MPPFAESFDTYIADFGVIAMGGTCTIGGTSVDGIFDENYAEFLNMVDGSKPVLQVPDANIPAGTKRNTAVVVKLAAWAAAISFTVADVQADGTGMTTLVLEKA